MSRSHEECISWCDDCSTCKNNHPYDSYKRYKCIGQIGYEMRLRAVSPPPPGSGPRYRSQCCWPSPMIMSECGTTSATTSGIDDIGFGCECDPSSPVSRNSLLATTHSQHAINSADIISSANRMKMTENATSEQAPSLVQQTSSATVRDIFYSGTCHLKSPQKRCALVRPQIYPRITDYGDTSINNNKDDIILERLPRFRFGGNRSVAAADKRGNDHRFKELSDRLKRGPGPIPPPRTRHASRIVSIPSVSTSESPTVTQDFNRRIPPLRSASFSQVDYCSDDNKYIRRRSASNENQDGENSSTANNYVATLPRTKNIVKHTATDDSKLPVNFKENTQQSEIGSTELSSSCNSSNNKVKLDDIKSESFPTVGPRPQKKQSFDKRRDKSRRRKGIYISQWPNTYQSSEEVIPQFVEESVLDSCKETSNKHLQDSLKDITKLQIQEKSEFPIWSSPQEEPLSPDESNTCPEWPLVSIRGRLVSQSSEEKEQLKNTCRGINLFRSDSLSEGEPDTIERKLDQISLAPSDISDCESRISLTTSPSIPRRYSKRPLRGPYGQMLEAEMKRPEGRKHIHNDLQFLEDLSSVQNKPKHTRGQCNTSLDETQLSQKNSKLLHKCKTSGDSSVPSEIESRIISHQRTSSSPSALERYSNNEVSSELLEQLLRGSSEQLAIADTHQQQYNDTRTHVVVELYDNERIYVESLQILVTKYLEPLKLPENANLLDALLVDEIFYQIPFLLSHHQFFLDELKKRLEHWDIKQKIGDIFLEMFSKSSVIESYTNYVNNWKRAREILKSAQQSKPAFGKFLENTSREHKGKLALDSLLIKPIQKFPKYELLIQRLIKHTDMNHPDHNLLLSAQKLVHDQLLKINCTEREALELEQLREIESLIEGLIDLVSTDRQYLRHDLVSMSAGGGARKERALFLFSDLLLITSIKRRSGTIKRPNTIQGSVTSTLEANKYKLLMKVPLEDLEVLKTKDDNLKQMMIEVDNLTEDISTLNQISELSWSLHCNHSQLDEIIKEMSSTLSKQLSDQQNSDSQLSGLDLTLNTPNGLENISILFSKSEKRTSWEESFCEAKQKLAISGDRRPCPELIATVPIRKTRAGLQFTCAEPTLSDSGKDVWVCNSDGYVGQVCVLSLTPEPTVASCNGVCNARILCIASVPGVNSSVFKSNGDNCNQMDVEDRKKNQFDSSSSSEDDLSDCEPNDESQGVIDSTDDPNVDVEESDNQQSTMWLGTEDGCIHVYNSNDNIRIKKNKIKLQHNSSILCIIYLDNTVFVSLASGDFVIYYREMGSWNINSPLTVTVGTTSTAVSKIVPSSRKLWCGCGSTIKIFNTETLKTENSFNVDNDSNKPISCIALCGNGVWLSLQNSAILKCFHILTFELLCEINVAPAVTKMLTSCDDIIRQHKAACLRVTALLACKDLLWIGTSAGVLLTIPLPHISPKTTKISTVPTITGVSHGHTGHVRFLTSVEMPFGNNDTQHRNSYKGKQEQRTNIKLLVISGGDGYEDFRTSNLSEVAGREDSTNHLLLWNI